MSGTLQGRRSIVTGSGSGLGRSIALRFANAGAKLALCDRDGVGLNETVAMVEASGGDKPVIKVFDLSDLALIASFVADAAEALGGIDVVCNNAAVAIRNSVEQQDEDSWMLTQNVNLRATFFMIQNALQHLRRGRGPAIVNIGSMAGSRGIAGLAAYCASKGGVNALTRALAVELAPDNIRVNAVSPGGMMTPAVHKSIDRINSMTPGKGEEAIQHLVSRQLFKRAANPDEVAAIVEFMASDAAGFLTGEIISASAGWAAN